MIFAMEAAVNPAGAKFRILTEIQSGISIISHN